MSNWTLIRFVLYLYSGIQFSILFYVYLKGYKLKPSKFPLYLLGMFFCMALATFMLALLVLLREISFDMSKSMSWIIALPTIPQIIFTHLFIGESLPDKLKKNFKRV